LYFDDSGSFGSIVHGTVRYILTTRVDGEVR
jgi:hypothetical protein